MELKEFSGYSTFLLCLLSFVVGMYIMFYRGLPRWAIAIDYFVAMVYVFVKKMKRD